jgi:hypothetical protein
MFNLFGLFAGKKRERENIPDDNDGVISGSSSNAVIDTPPAADTIIDGRPLKIADTYHDFGTGPRGKMDFKSGEKEIFDDRLFTVLSRAVQNANPTCEDSIVPQDVQTIYNCIDPSIRTTDIEDTVISYYEKTYPNELGTVTTDAMLTYDFILANTNQLQAGGRVTYEMTNALKTFLEKPILLLTTGEMPVDNLFDSNNTFPSDAILKNRRSVAHFMLTYLFGTNYMKTPAYATFDATPGLPAKILSSQDNTYALTVPQNITDAANTSYTQFNGRINFFVFPNDETHRYDEKNPYDKNDSAEKIEAKRYSTSENLYTGDRYEIYFENDSFTRQTPTKFKYVIHDKRVPQVVTSDLVLSYENYKQGPSVNDLIKCVIAADADTLKNISSSSSITQPYGKLLAQNAKLFADVSTHAGDLFFDEKRGGDENQVMAVKNLNKRGMQVLLGTADRPCFLKARIENVPVSFHVHGNKYTTLAKPRMTLTAEQKAKMRQEELADVRVRADYVATNITAIVAYLEALRGQLTSSSSTAASSSNAAVPTPVTSLTYPIVVDLHNAKIADNQAMITNIGNFLKDYIGKAAKTTPNALQQLYMATAASYNIDDYIYDILSSDIYKTINASDMFAAITHYDYSVFTAIEDTIVAVYKALNTVTTKRRQELVDSVAVYSRVERAFEKAFGTFIQKDVSIFENIQEELLLDDAILAKATAEPTSQDVKNAVVTNLVKIMTNTVDGLGGGGHAMKGGAVTDLTANDINEFILACEPIAKYVNQKIVAIHPPFLLYALMQQYMTCTDPVQKEISAMQIRREMERQGIAPLSTLNDMFAKFKASLTPAVVSKLLNSLRNAIRDDALGSDTVLVSFLADWNSRIGKRAGADYEFIERFLRPYTYIASDGMSFDVKNSPYGNLGNPYVIQDSLYEFALDTSGNPERDNKGSVTPLTVSQYITPHILITLSLIYGFQTSANILLPLLQTVGFPARMKGFTTWTSIKGFIASVCFTLPQNTIRIHPQVATLLGGRRHRNKTRRHRDRNAVRRVRKTRRHR